MLDGTSRQVWRLHPASATTSFERLGGNQIRMPHDARDSYYERELFKVVPLFSTKRGNVSRLPPEIKIPKEASYAFFFSVFSVGLIDKNGGS